jgi:hypothetical protein
VDARSEKLFKDLSNFRNFELSSKIKVNQKGKTFYSLKGNNV